MRGNRGCGAADFGGWRSSRRSIVDGRRDRAVEGEDGRAGGRDRVTEEFAEASEVQEATVRNGARDVWDEAGAEDDGQAGARLEAGQTPGDAGGEAGGGSSVWGAVAGL